MHGVIAFVSATSSATKTWLGLGAIVAVPALCFVTDWMAKRSIERRARALMRERPELAGDLEDFLRRLHVRRSLREWYRDERRLQEISPPPRMAVDRKALPIWLALLTVLAAALVAQAALDSEIAGWVALAGLPVVLTYGASLLWPSARNKYRDHSS